MARCYTPVLLKLRIRKKVKIIFHCKLFSYTIAFWKPAQTIGFQLVFTTAIADDNKIANGQFLNKDTAGNITEETFVHFLRLPKLKMTISQSKPFEGYYQ